MAKKILIVDDDQDVIVFLTTLLQDKGYQVVHALNGRMGLDMANAEAPDLILLDLMMPQKSGISLLGDLKKDAHLKNIPVIMVTGVARETGINLESFFVKSEKKGKEARPLRPDGYLEKPVDPEKLITLIEEFFN
jgi:twitching motility two-component system response regulator PilH